MEEANIFDEIRSQVESSQWKTQDGSIIRKRQFTVGTHFDERPPTKKPALPEDVPSPQNSQSAIMATLDAIQKRQEEVFAKLNSVETRQLEMGETINPMQGALSEKMPERSEIQAQSKLLRECRVLTARVQQSVSRITGDVETEESTDLASMFPMSSVEQVQAAEAKLKTKAYADAMMGLLARQKGTKGTVDGVMRGLFTDETVAHFNLEGRAGKIPLVGLKVVDLLFGFGFGWY